MLIGAKNTSRKCQLFYKATGKSEIVLHFLRKRQILKITLAVWAVKKTKETD